MELKEMLKGQFIELETNRTLSPQKLGSKNN
jgi:hypothetical protein